MCWTAAAWVRSDLDQPYGAMEYWRSHKPNASFYVSGPWAQFKLTINCSPRVLSDESHSNPARFSYHAHYKNFPLCLFLTRERSTGNGCSCSGSTRSPPSHTVLGPPICHGGPEVSFAETRLDR
jgi:hypothetical protein